MLARKIIPVHVMPLTEESMLTTLKKQLRKKPKTTVLHTKHT